MKIAVGFLPTAGRANELARGGPARRLLAQGDGWSVSDVLCGAGPRDRPFEEQHSRLCIGIVVEGSFQYRSTRGRELMTPGSLLLGNPGQFFECCHEHAVGDRCISFGYESRYIEDLIREAGVGSRNARFLALRVPPVRSLSSLVARACAGLAEAGNGALGTGQNILAPGPQHFAGGSLKNAGYSTTVATRWEEIGIQLAVQALEIASSGEPNRRNFLAAEARVTRIVRQIESRPELEHRLDALAREARLSRYHFLRVFQQLTGLTPHQYILRARLRQAAARLILEPTRVLDIALDSGFGDVSNFNHAFSAEFGMNPRTYRRSAGHGTKGI